MKRPLCSCGRPAEYSLCVLVSTLAVRPRRQKCGRAQLLCASCMRELVNKQCHHTASGVLESLRSAYTALLEISEPPVAFIQCRYSGKLYTRRAGSHMGRAKQPSYQC